MALIRLDQPAVQQDSVLGLQRPACRVVAKGWDWEQRGILLDGRSRPEVFEPVMTHSYGEGTRPVWFHGQMICDLAAVVEAGEHIVEGFRGLEAAAHEAGGRYVKLVINRASLSAKLIRVRD